MNADRIDYVDSDETALALPAIGGVTVLQGVTERGPINDPSRILYSWEDYKALYGGLLATSDFPLIVKRALDGGSPVRVNRIAHYTDITEASTLTATRPAAKNIFKSGSVVAELPPPANFMATALNTGGSLADGTYQFRVTALNANGETLPSNQSSGTPSGGGSGSVSLEWDPVPGAVSYRVYKDGTNYMGTSQTTYVWTGAAPGVVGTLPVENTTSSDGIAFGTVRPKYAGAVIPEIEFANPSNGLITQGYFDIRVSVNGALTEHYKNLKIIGKPNVGNSTWLSKLNSSNLIEYAYLDLSNISGGQLIVEKETIEFASGSDGDAVVATDYIGDSGAGTGFFALDGYDDFYQFSAPEISDEDIHNAGALYAANRGDCEYWAHLDNDSTTVDALIAERELVTVDTKYLSIFAGGLKVLHPINNTEVEISEIGDMAAIQANVDKNYAPWLSAANFVRASLRNNALGVVNNFGSKGDYLKLNQLTQSQINMMVQSNNRIYMSSNVSGQFDDTKASYRNVVRGIIYIKKAIYPILTKYLQEPPTFSTFKALFNDVQPILEDMADRRAFSTTPTTRGYKWMGDQDASTYEELIVNSKAELDEGNYKVRLELDFLSSINLITIEFALVDSTVTTEIIENTL